MTKIKTKYEIIIEYRKFHQFYSRHVISRSIQNLCQKNSRIQDGILKRIHRLESLNIRHQDPRGTAGRQSLDGEKTAFTGRKAKRMAHDGWVEGAHG